MNKTVKHQMDIILRDITSLGGLSFFILLSILVLLLQKFELLTELLLGFLVTFAVVILVRTFYFKDRPNKREFSNYFEKMEASSFPSLHSARVVFTAAVFARFIADKNATIFLVILAALVCYSRIYMKKHDWWDISFGVLLGLLTSWLVSLL